MSTIEKLLERIYNKPVSEILREFYTEQDMTLVEIAQELDIGKDTVRKLIIKYGLHKKRPPWNLGLNKDEQKKIIELGKSVEKEYNQ